MFSMRLISLLLAAAGAAAQSAVFNVIDDLKEMLATLEKDQATDDDIYKDASCLCKTDIAALTKNISDGEAHMASLTAKMTSLNATVKKLTAEISALESEVQADTNSLQTATNLRTQEQDEFNETETYMLELIVALNASIDILSKHHKQASFLQRPVTPMKRTASTLSQQMQRHASLFKGALSSKQQKALDYFVHVQLGQEPTYHAEYAPQSGEIFGILQQLLEDFENDLSDARAKELKAMAAYSALKSAKEVQIQTANDSLDRKRGEKAQAEVDTTQAQADFDSTQAAVAADQQTLDDLNVQCPLTDQTYAEHKEMRSREMAAVSKAISILSNDNSMDTFHATNKRQTAASFLQLASPQQPSVRARAVTALLNATGNLHSHMIASVAAQVKLDDFTEVKAAIDKMVSDLEKEKQDEIDFVAQCQNISKVNVQETSQAANDKSLSENTIGQLEAAIGILVDELANLKAEVDTAHTDTLRAAEVREQENHVFQQDVAHTRDSLKLLKEAKEALEKFYHAEFLQMADKNGTSPYMKHAGGNDVIALIDQIIQDTTQFESTLASDENASQSAYEETVAGWNLIIEHGMAAMRAKETEKADKEQDLAEEKANLDSLNSELNRLAKSAAAIEEECGFTTKNFEVRQTARDDEIKALLRAKEILSGEA